MQNFVPLVITAPVLISLELDAVCATTVVPVDEKYALYVAPTFRDNVAITALLGTALFALTHM